MNEQSFTIESEQLAIGALLIDNDSFDEIHGLKAEAFCREDHRIIYKTICGFLDYGKPVDLILLAEELSRKGDLQRVGDLAYIGAIVQSCGTSKTIKRHAKAIDKAWKIRRLKSLLAELEILADSRSDIDEITEKAEKELFNILENNEESKIVHVKDAVIEAVEWEDLEVRGVNTGIRDLDRLTNGFSNSDMIIIAARPSMGKTSLAVQIAEHVSLKETVVVFSLEMSRRQIATRQLRFHENRVGKSQAISHLSNLKLFIDDKPSVTVAYIRSQCRKIKRKHGLSMIVVDYLQLMRGEGDNRNQEIGGISRGLKSIAKEFDIPVIALSQLSRKVDERADKRPLNSDLRDSGEIEQDADQILFIYRDEVYNNESDFCGKAEIIVRKNRNGSIGEVMTNFSGELTRFSDYNGPPIARSVKSPAIKNRVFLD